MKYNTKKMYLKVTRDPDTNKKKVIFGKAWGALSKDNANSEGTLTGNGLMVVDIDTKDMSKIDSKLVRLLGDPTVETANGYHYYFTGDVKEIKQTQGLFDLVDIRNEGGFVFSEYWGNDPTISYKKVGKPQYLKNKLKKYLIKASKNKTKQIKNKIGKMVEVDGTWECAKDGEHHQTTLALMIRDFKNGATYNEVWTKSMLYIDKYLNGNHQWEDKRFENRIKDTYKMFGNERFGFKSRGKELVVHKAKQKIDVEIEKKEVPNKNVLEKIKGLGMQKEDYTKIENQKYYIHQFLPNGGLFMFAGDSGSGKSWLSFMAVKRVLASHKNTSCIFIDLDSGAIYTKKRVYSLWSDFGEDRFTYISQTKTDAREVIEHLKNLQNVNLNNTIIVIDSLVGITDGNINESNIIKPILTLFEGLRNQGATVILIHHTKKTFDKNSIPVYAGSFTIKGAMDALYMVSKEKTLITCHLDKARGDYIPRTFEINDFEKMEAKDIDYRSPEDITESKKLQAIEFEEIAISKILGLSSKPITKMELERELIDKERYAVRRAKNAIKRALEKGFIKAESRKKNEKRIVLTHKFNGS